jgi:hypothetical protein
MTFSIDHDAQSQEQTNNDQLTFKVGERDYDVQSAATKIEASDEHIKKIEAENAAYREELEKAKLELASATKLEEALQKLQTPATPQENLSGASQALSEDQIGEIAAKQLQDVLARQDAEKAKEAAQAQAIATFNETKSALEGQYGDKLDEVMNDKAKEMGVSISHLIELASAPATAKLLLDSMKVQRVDTSKHPSGSFNTTSFQGRQAPSNEGWHRGSSKDIMAELQRLRQNS